MGLGSRTTLLTTVCNTLPTVVAYSLGLRIGGVDWFVDLADALNQPGDIGLTGAVWLDGEILLAVQSAGAPRIQVLDHRLRPIRTIRHDGFADLHSLHVADGAVLAISTGNETVWRLSPAGGVVDAVYRAPGVIHLNAVAPGQGGPILCAHSLAPLSATAKRGGLIAATTGAVVIDDLTHPHSPLRIDDQLYVLDSSAETLIALGPNGRGFLRGMALVGGDLLVGAGPGRMVSRKNPVAPTHRDLWDAFGARNTIRVVDRATLTVRETWHPTLAGFEIYELLAPPEGALDPDPTRLIHPDPSQLARAYYESAKRLGAALSRLRRAQATSPKQ